MPDIEVTLSVLLTRSAHVKMSFLNIWPGRIFIANVFDLLTVSAMAGGGGRRLARLEVDF